VDSPVAARAARYAHAPPLGCQTDGSRSGGSRPVDGLHKRIEELLAIATELAAGNFAVAIPAENHDDELAAIRAALDMLAGDLRTGARERLAARERQGLLKKVRQSESSLRALISQLPAHVWTIDIDGRVRLPDPDRPGPLVGYELDGQYIGAALGLPGDAPGIAVHEAALKGVEGACELATQGRSWDLRVTPMRDGDETVGAVSVAIDVTDARAAQAQRNHAQKLESLGVMAGGIAHDFNNLLVGVLANAGLALEDLPVDSPARDALQRIERAAERAAGLTHQLLAYSGRGRFVVEQLSMPRLVEEMSELLRVGLEHRIELRLHLDPASPPVRGDPSQLRQVVMNLITNAADASLGREGAIDVRVGPRDVEAAELRSLRVADGVEPGRFCCVEVEDTLDRIFDPFFSTKESGHGLGLAAALGIVNGHGGAVDVRSSPGVGTRFLLLFPADTEAWEEATSAPAGRHLRPRQADLRVLVADDELPVRQAARAVLERVGYRVVLAADGREALQLFTAAPDSFDCALIDLTMPFLSGAEVLAELHRVRPELPVVLTSGYSEHEVSELIGVGRPLIFLQKPWRAASLLTMLDRVLRRATT
jgi:signal transduction histidine kinase